MKPSPGRTVTAIVVMFSAFSFLWIVGTARFVEPLAASTGLSEGAVEIGKGLLFVVCTAALLLVSLGRYSRSLLASEQQWLQLAQTTQDGLFVVRLGARPRFVFVNPAMEAITGHPASAFTADVMLPLRLARPVDRPTVLAIYRDPGQLREPVRVGIERPDGTLRWVRLSASVVTASANDAVLQGLVVDVTQDRARERSLERAALTEHAAAEQLRASDRAKQAFLTAVSHELRTPLTVVYGMAQTLLRHGDRLTDAERQRAQTSMAEHANRLRSTLDDLLDVDRLERGMLPTTFDQVDLAAVVAEAVASSSARSRTRITAPDRLMARADAVQVSRIVANLLDNAEKYAPQGTIDVTLESDDTAHWRLSVHDRGPGIPEHERERVFEAFHRIDDEHPQPGTGIGLALVSEFAKLHGGHARAIVDDGLTVTVEIPVEASAGEDRHDLLPTS